MPAPVFALMATAALLAARFLPVQRLAPACPLKTHTGWPCLTCGSTRAFVRFVHGDFVGAFAMSPLGTVLAAGGALLAVYVLLRWTLIRRRPILRLNVGARRKLRWTVLAALAVHWVYLVQIGR